MRYVIKVQGLGDLILHVKYCMNSPILCGFHHTHIIISTCSNVLNIPNAKYLCYCTCKAPFKAHNYYYILAHKIGSIMVTFSVLAG